MLPLPSVPPTPTPEKVSIILAEDHGVVLEGMRLLLMRSMKYEVLGQAMDGEELIALVNYCHPRIVVLDTALPGVGSAELIHEIKGDSERAGVIMLTMRGEFSAMRQLLAMGADAYVMKDSLFQDLEIAIDQVAMGGFFLSAGLEAVLRVPRGQGIFRRFPNGGVSFPLSFREIEVLRLLSQGCGPETISQRLGLNLRGVNGYRQRIARKTGLNDAQELLEFALSLKQVFDLEA